MPLLSASWILDLSAPRCYRMADNNYKVQRKIALMRFALKQHYPQVFKTFLEGSSLSECYAAVAEVANRLLDLLHNKGSVRVVIKRVFLSSMATMMTWHGTDRISVTRSSLI